MYHPSWLTGSHFIAILYTNFMLLLFCLAAAHTVGFQNDPKVADLQPCYCPEKYILTWYLKTIENSSFVYATFWSSLSYQISNWAKKGQLAVMLLLRKHMLLN